MMAACPLFPLFSTQAFLRVWQMNYCESDFTRCARFKAAQRGETVRPTLLPNGKHLPVLPSFGGAETGEPAAAPPVTQRKR